MGGKIFAVLIVIIALASAVPIMNHTFLGASVTPPEDISTHGKAIDDQLSVTMAEAGISFLAAQLVLGLFVWQFANRKAGTTKRLPGGATAMVIVAFLFVGAEVLALGLLFRLQEFLIAWGWAPWSDLFRVDILKIAREFVQEIGSDEEKARVASAVVRLGSTLSLDVVVEERDELAVEPVPGGPDAPGVLDRHDRVHENTVEVEEERFAGKAHCVVVPRKG